MRGTEDSLLKTLRCDRVTVAQTGGSRLLDANSVGQQGLFQPGWFVVLLTQMLIVHMVRTLNLPFVQSCDTPRP